MANEQTSGDVLNAAAAAMLADARKTNAGRDTLRALDARHREELEAGAAAHRERMQRR